MSDTPRPFKKMAGRVEVLYFPKRRRQRSGTVEAQIETRTMTIPDLETVVEPVSDPRARTKTPVLLEATDPGVALQFDGGKKKRTRSGASRKVTPTQGSGRRRTTAELSLDSDVPAPKVEEVLAEKSPLSVLRRLTRRQLTELSVEGHGYFESGDYDTSRKLFEHLVALEPTEAFPYTMLGTIFLALGQQDRALALFEAALGVDRKDLAARVYRGEVRLHRGRYKLAIDDLQRALDLGEAADPFVDRARRLLKIARQAYTAEQSGKKRR
jgi:hypothetical protein